MLNAEIREVSDGCAVLELAGEIDMATSSVIDTRFADLAERGLTDVVIDAREVTFMDSTGVHAFVEGKRTIHDRGSRLFLVASAPVTRILDLMFSGPLFAARYDSVEDAIAAIKADPH